MSDLKINGKLSVTDSIKGGGATLNSLNINKDLNVKENIKAEGSISSKQVSSFTTGNTFTCSQELVDNYNQICVAVPFFNTNEYYTLTIPTSLLKTLANYSGAKLVIQASSSGTTCFVEFSLAKNSTNYVLTGNFKNAASGNRWIIFS